MPLQYNCLTDYNTWVIMRTVTSKNTPRWQVVYYRDRRGRHPVREFLDSLSATDRAKVRNALRLLREFGVLLQMPHARPVSGHRRLWELRAGAIRLFYFAHTGQQFIILHAFRKKSQRIPAQEIAIAERRMTEILEEEQ